MRYACCEKNNGDGMKRRLFVLASLASGWLLYMSVTSWIAGISYWREAEALGRVPTIGPNDLVFLAIKLNKELATRQILWAVCFSAATLASLIITYYLWAGLHKSKLAADGLCPRCSYNLTGNTSGVCPECGTAVAGKA